MRSDISLSVIVPVFNNQESLLELNQELEFELLRLNLVKLELIYVNDGSVDDSLDTLLYLMSKNKISTTVVDLVGNFGQANAILAGIQHSRFDIVSTISADLQDPPEIVSKMLEQFKDNKRLVIAERISRDDSIPVRIGSWITYRLLRVLSREMPRGGFDCWMTEKKLARYFLSQNTIFSMKQQNFFKLGVNVGRIEYHRRERKYGKSGFSFYSKFRMLTEAIIANLIYFSTFFVATGLLISSLSVLLFIVILQSYFSGFSPFQGFTLLAGTSLMFGSFIILSVSTILIIVAKLSERDISGRNFIINKIYRTTDNNPL